MCRIAACLLLALNFLASSAWSSTSARTLGYGSSSFPVLEYNSTNLTLDVVAGPDQQTQSAHGSAYYEPYETSAGADGSGNLSSPGATVPEPGSLLLLASGILGIVGLRRHRSRGNARS